jgi:hypothetical protein
MLGAGLIEALLLARALPGERVIWPLRMAGVCSFITLSALVVARCLRCLLRCVRVP